MCMCVYVYTHCYWVVSPSSKHQTLNHKPKPYVETLIKGHLFSRYSRGLRKSLHSGRYWTKQKPPAPTGS